MRYAIATDCGRERENNEDAARAVPELGLFVIADGMGGHVAGEIASRIAVDTLIAFAEGNPPGHDAEDEASLLCEAALEANTAVLHEAERRNLFGMGTTLTALWIRGSMATVCHVGDTRAWLLGEGELTVLTQDQNMVSLLIEQGVITAEEAKHHPERHMLTQALGTQSNIEPQVIQAQLSGCSRILLSTDGLHDVVPTDEIAEIAAQADLEAAVHALIQRANEYGGPDNVTVILIEP